MRMLYDLGVPAESITDAGSHFPLGRWKWIVAPAGRAGHVFAVLL